jgi:hypothetical protein
MKTAAVTRRGIFTFTAAALVTRVGWLRSRDANVAHTGAPCGGLKPSGR